MSQRAKSKDMFLKARSLQGMGYQLGSLSPDGLRDNKAVLCVFPAGSTCRVGRGLLPGREGEETGAGKGKGRKEEKREETDTQRNILFPTFSVAKWHMHCYLPLCSHRFPIFCSPLLSPL